MGGCGGQGAEEVVGEEVEVTADIPPPTEAQICRFPMSRLENVTKKNHRFFYVEMRKRGSCDPVFPAIFRKRERRET